MGVDSVQHRPGNLKQQNKSHKHGRHRSKGSIDKLNKGRAIILKAHGKKKQELSREVRRHQACQIRQKKRFDYLQKRRGICEAPFLVAVVPLNSCICSKDIVTRLNSSDSEAIVVSTAEGHNHISIPRLKHKFTLIPSTGDNLFDTLDLLKAADTVLFLTSVQGVDAEGQITLTSALAQGLPTTLVVCMDIDTVPLKRRQEVKNNVQKELEKWLPDEKIQALEKNGDELMVFRRIANQKQRSVMFRDNRPHLLAENVHFIETSVGKGVLKVTGYLRGQTLNVNSLIHIPGWGDFKISQIDSPPDPFSDSPNQDIKVLEKADPEKQWSLDRENIPDPMDAEQTWPTEEEIAEAEAERKVRKVKKKPHGWSDYQAAWIPDNDAFEISDEDVEEEDCEDGMEAKSEKSSDQGDYDDEMDTITEASEAPVPADKYDREIDQAEEEVALKNLKEAAEDKEFPDEMDTPANIPARERFLKYRGLMSFRTSPWNSKENLPSDYARIFQFQNFERTRRQILKEQEETTGALAGWYITIYIEDIPSYLFRLREEQPIVVYGLLPHEQKMSVVNVVLKRPAMLESDAPVKSKESLLFQCGFRRFRAQPIFSQHTKGNKFKYERFFQSDSTVVATMFAPIVFPPCPVLTFKEQKDGTSVLIATGNVLSVDPNRIIVKRAVLSGHPFKVNKKSAVIRFMFFNREDIEWFKPVELHTKYGRRGHIKEPLGTHGHMKCVFNGQLKSQDTILLNLYKRVFPKWTYEPNTTFTRVMEENENMDT